MSSIAGGLLLAVVAGLLNGSWNLGFSPRVGCAIGRSNKEKKEDKTDDTSNTNEQANQHDEEAPELSNNHDLGVVIEEEKEPEEPNNTTKDQDNPQDKQQPDLGYHHAFVLFQFYAALINIPICLYWAGGPERVNYIMQEASPQDITLICLFSLVWGLGSLGFGMACKIAGIGLGTNLCLGVVMVLGTFLPLCMEGAILTPGGGMVVGGLVFVCIGLVFSAWSLQARDFDEQRGIALINKSRHMLSQSDDEDDTEWRFMVHQDMTTVSLSFRGFGSTPVMPALDNDETFRSAAEDMIYNVDDPSFRDYYDHSFRSFGQSSRVSASHRNDTSSKKLGELIVDVDEHSFRSCFTRHYPNSSQKKLEEILFEVEEPDTSQRQLGEVIVDVEEPDTSERKLGELIVDVEAPETSEREIIFDVEEPDTSDRKLGETIVDVDEHDTSQKKLGETIVGVDQPGHVRFGRLTQSMEDIIFYESNSEINITEVPPIIEESKRRGDLRFSSILNRLRQQQEYSTFYKVLVCIIAGVFGTQLQFVFVFGKDLIELAEDNTQGPGSTPAGGGPAVIWLIAIALGAPVWIAYGLYHSPLPISAIWKCPWYRHVLLILTTSAPWIAHIHLYGYSTSLLPEDLAAAVSWPTIMSVTVVTGMMWSLVLGEWQFASKRAMRKLFQGVGFVLLGIAIIMASITL